MVSQCVNCLSTILTGDVDWSISHKYEKKVKVDPLVRISNSVSSWFSTRRVHLYFWWYGVDCCHVCGLSSMGRMGRLNCSINVLCSTCKHKINKAAETTVLLQSEGIFIFTTEKCCGCKKILSGFEVLRAPAIWLPFFSFF